MVDPENNTESRNSVGKRIELGDFGAMLPLKIETADEGRYYHLSLTLPEHGIGLVRTGLLGDSPDFVARDSIYRLGSRPWQEGTRPPSVITGAISPPEMIEWGSLTSGEELVMELLETEQPTLFYTGHQVSDVVPVEIGPNL